jgi:tripartite-type tricarboxylate transporter receptor subunit TctC
MRNGRDKSLRPKNKIRKGGRIMKKQRSIKLLLTAVGFFVLVNVVFFTGIARAEYPEKEITMLAFADPGTTGDILIRGLIIGASAYLKRPIVIEYKSGAGGMLAASVVAAAKPDGYTLCHAPSAAIIDGALMQKAAFKPLKSFTPVTVFAMSEHTGTLVAPDAPWKTFKEFVDYSKNNPGKVKYGTSFGSGMHVAMEFVKQQDNINWVLVPFTTGGPARTAVMGHHIDAVASGADWPPFVESGQLRILVTHGRTRAPASPNVPNLIELGYNYAGAVLQSILGPAGLPPDVVAKLEAAFAKGIETPEFKAAVQKVYQTPYYLSSKDYDRYLKENWTKTEKMFKQFGMIKEAATQPE